MSSEEKKAYILLKCVIFHYHGLDEDEQKILDDTAAKLNAQDELKWANDFVEKDYFNAFDRAREYLQGVMTTLEKEKRLRYLKEVWDANLTKGYISEMEAMAMIKLSKDWDIERELIASIKK